MKDLKEILGIISDKIKKEECVEVISGIYISTSSSIIDEQTRWHDEDTAKNIDFSGDCFWMTTNTGDEPYPLDDNLDDEYITEIFSEYSIEELNEKWVTEEPSMGN